MIRKEHLTEEGLIKIISILSSNNKSLNEQVTKSFTGILPIERPLVVEPEEIYPHRLAGFVDGEGCFFLCKFLKRQQPKQGIQ